MDNVSVVISHHIVMDLLQAFHGMKTFGSLVLSESLCVNMKMVMNIQGVKFNKHHEAVFNHIISSYPGIQEIRALERHPNKNVLMVAWHRLLYSYKSRGLLKHCINTAVRLACTRIGPEHGVKENVTLITKETDDLLSALIESIASTPLDVSISELQDSLGEWEIILTQIKENSMVYKGVNQIK